jgi:hypothetical protein
MSLYSSRTAPPTPSFDATVTSSENCDENGFYVKRATKDWKYNVVSIGYPGAVIDGKILMSPTISVAVGSDLILARHSGVPSRSSMTLPCNRSEAMKEAVCSSWGSVPVLTRR